MAWRSDKSGAARGQQEIGDHDVQCTQVQTWLKQCCVTTLVRELPLVSDYFPHFSRNLAVFSHLLCTFCICTLEDVR